MDLIFFQLQQLARAEAEKAETVYIFCIRLVRDGAFDDFDLFFRQGLPLFAFAFSGVQIVRDLFFDNIDVLNVFICQCTEVFESCLVSCH